MVSGREGMHSTSLIYEDLVMSCPYADCVSLLFFCFYYPPSWCLSDSTRWVPDVPWGHCVVSYEMGKERTYIWVVDLSNPEYSNPGPQPGRGVGGIRATRFGSH